MASFILMVSVWILSVSARAGDLLSPAISSTSTVDDLIRIALDRSPDIRAAAAEVLASRGERSAAGEWSNPEVDASIGGKRQAGAGELGTGSAWDLKVMQAVDLSGKRSVRKSAADAEIRLKELSLRRVTAETQARASGAIVELAGALGKEEIARRHSTRQQDAFRLVAGRPAGTPAIAVEQETLRLATVRTRRELLEAQSAVRLSWLALDRMVHLHRTDPVPLPPLLLANVPELDLAVLRRRVSERLNELQEARAELDGLAARTRAAELEPWPDLSLGPILERSSALDRESTVGLGLSFSLPIWSRHRGDIDAARAREAAGRIRVEAAEHDAGHLADILETRFEAARLRCAEEPYARLEELDRQSEDIVRQFTEGRISVQALLSADTEIEDAANAIVDAHVEVAEAAIDLMLAAGLLKERP